MDLGGASPTEAAWLYLWLPSSFRAVRSVSTWDEDLTQDESESHGLSLAPDLSPRSRNPSAPKSPRPTFMQHYQVPSAEYSSYISHVISLGLAEDYIAQLRASCSSNSPPPLRAAID